MCTLCHLFTESPKILPSNLGDIFVRKGKDVKGICFQTVTGSSGVPKVTKGITKRKITKFTFDGRCLSISAEDVKDHRYVVLVSNLHGRATATFRLVYYGKCFPPPGLSDLPLIKWLCLYSRGSCFKSLSQEGVKAGADKQQGNLVAFL